MRPMSSGSRRRSRGCGRRSGCAIPDELRLMRAVPGLSNEMVERLSAARPATLGEAGRVRGVTPAALAAILVATRRKAA